MKGTHCLHMISMNPIRALNVFSMCVRVAGWNASHVPWATSTCVAYCFTRQSILYDTFATISCAACEHEQRHKWWSNMKPLRSPRLRFHFSNRFLPPLRLFGIQPSTYFSFEKQTDLNWSTQTVICRYFRKLFGFSSPPLPSPSPSPFKISFISLNREPFVMCKIQILRLTFNRQSTSTYMSENKRIPRSWMERETDDGWSMSIVRYAAESIHLSNPQGVKMCRAILHATKFISHKDFKIQARIVSPPIGSESVPEIYRTVCSKLIYLPVRHSQLVVTRTGIHHVSIDAYVCDSQFDDDWRGWVGSANGDAENTKFYRRYTRVGSTSDSREAISLLSDVSTQFACVQPNSFYEKVNETINIDYYARQRESAYSGPRTLETYTSRTVNP